MFGARPSIFSGVSRKGKKVCNSFNPAKPEYRNMCLKIALTKKKKFFKNFTC